MRTLPVVLLAGLALARQRQDVVIDPAQLAAFAPLPASVPSEANPITPEKAELGWRLYYETQLSADGSQSCNSCHLLDAYGVGGQPVSTGVTGEKGGRNAPTVHNAAGHIAQFWDGRATDVEEQAKERPARVRDTSARVPERRRRHLTFRSASGGRTRWTCQRRLGDSRWPRGCLSGIYRNAAGADEAVDAP
jgi:hypothetical protein